MATRELFARTTYDGVTYVCPTWEQMGDQTFQLAQNIIATGNQYDRVVALAKGGWTWARTLVDYLGVRHLSSTRLKSYSGINKSEGVVILQPLADPIHGERVLIFDEVADSGNTLKKAKEYITILGSTEAVVATLCYKPRSLVVPDYYAFRTDGWVVFPHERREFIDIVGAKWTSQDIPLKEIRTRLTNIGIPETQVNNFLDLQIKSRIT